MKGPKPKYLGIRASQGITPQFRHLDLSPLYLRFTIKFS